jgi:hypothetical protein
MGESNGVDATKIESLFERLRARDRSAQTGLIVQTCECLPHLATWPVFFFWPVTESLSPPFS